MNEMIITVACVLSAVALLSVGFFVGKKTSDDYNRLLREEVRNALQKQYVRLVAKTDADDPVQPYTPPPRQNIIGEEFMETLRRHGKATERIC